METEVVILLPIWHKDRVSSVLPGSLLIKKLLTDDLISEYWCALGLLT